MILYVDIDGVLCTNTGGTYHDAQPIQSNIDRINQYHDAGHEVHLWTARGSRSGIDHLAATQAQMRRFGVKFTTCNVGKPHYDVWIDDKANRLTFGEIGANLDATRILPDVNHAADMRITGGA